MRFRFHILCFLLAVQGLALYLPSSAQTGFQIDIPKPKAYENRVLKAEKTDDKKLKTTKRFFQNLTTHYNYFFNASNKLNEIIERAKAAHRENYTTLLPFYNYSLDVTAMDQLQLDSVIYKSQTGIVLHDLRSDWIDNLYLLWGAAFYLEKKFDSAALMFQFINYSFAEKEKDGYYRFIGSRLDGNSAESIVTNEKYKFPKNVLSTRPSRNDALLWNIRTMIQTDHYSEAGTFIQTMLLDPGFPQRLKPELEEIEAYWFYQKSQWDSSAHHLELALNQAKNKQEMARWQFLIAQMLEKTGSLDQARKYYGLALGNTLDPVMEIYARLNLVRLNKSGGDHYIDENIASLVKMAKKDKYEAYRSDIYFMAAQLELERNNPEGARMFLIKAARYNVSDIASKNNAFLRIADLSFDQKNYLQAASYYDSVQLNAVQPEIANRIADRKIGLAKIVKYQATYTLQDSLQKIASMPEEERREFIKKLIKKLRKSQGLKEETILTSGSAPVTGPDLFSNPSKGEWYFYNPSLKTQGSAQFKQVWGTRPNTDNWRRFKDVSMQLQAAVPNNTRGNDLAFIQSATENITPTSDNLLANIPLTPQQLLVSNDSIKMALYGLGNTYLNDLEDYTSAIEAFEKLRSRFPDFKPLEDLLLQLQYAYKKAGKADKAKETREIIQNKFPGTRAAEIVSKGIDPVARAQNNPEATSAYEHIYDLFISGSFNEALTEKRKADSMYKTSHWQPQLLYIEAVYHAKQREDSMAQSVLHTLIAQNQGTALAAKAQNLSQVLSRRKQIEDELSRMQLTMPDTAETIKPAIAQAPPAVLPQPSDSFSLRARNNAVTNQQARNIQPEKRTVLLHADTLQKQAITKTIKNAFYQFDPASKHYAMIILNKVDKIFGNEAGNAFNRYNKENYYNKPLQTEAVDLDADNHMLLIGGFDNAQEAMDYALKVKKIAGSEIVPWLKADKYSVSIISAPNLEILKARTDLVAYKSFLNQVLPGKF